MGSRTVGDALGVEVGLHVRRVDADPLKVDLVLDIAHKDEGGDDALALRRRCLGAYLAVPDVVCRGQQSANRALGHGQQRRLLAAAVGVDGGRALRLPVDLGGVAEVLVDRLHVVERVERIRARLAHGAGHTRVERVRHKRVTPAEAEGAHAAVAIDCGLLAARHQGVRRDAREQHGVSCGQWLSAEHFAPAKTVVAKAATAMAAERVTRTIMVASRRFPMLCKDARSCHQDATPSAVVSTRSIQKLLPMKC